MEYKLGDRVITTKEYMGIPFGSEGTVCQVYNTHSSIGIQFDKHIDGHDCTGHCKKGYGYFLSPRHLAKLSELKFKIVKK